MRSALKAWFPLAILATLVMGFMFVAAQQILRQSANDPQIQMAEDWADQISTGASATSLAMGPFIDPEHSLANFGIVYDRDGNIASSSITAPTTMLQPGGVLSAVDNSPSKELRFTWKPATGSRFATVIKRTTFGDKTYYVLAARNLREVEARQGQLLLLAFCTWAATLVILLLAFHPHIATWARRYVFRKQPL